MEHFHFVDVTEETGEQGQSFEDVLMVVAGSEMMVEILLQKRQMRRRGILLVDLVSENPK